MVFEVRLADGRVVRVKATSASLISRAFPGARFIRNVTEGLTAAQISALPSVGNDGRLRAAGSGTELDPATLTPIGLDGGEGPQSPPGPTGQGGTGPAGTAGSSGPVGATPAGTGGGGNIPLGPSDAGGVGRPQPPNLPPLDPSFDETQQPFAAFVRGLQQANLPTRGFLGSQFRDRFSPVQSLFDASNIAGVSPLGPGRNDFQQFASQFGGNRPAASQLALDTLSSLFGGGGGETGNLFANPDVGVSFGRLAGEQSEAGQASERNARQLLDLVGQALGNRTTGFVANRIAPIFERNLLRDFEENVTPTQGPNADFGSFFRQRASRLLGL